MAGRDNNLGPESLTPDFLRTPPLARGALDRMPASQATGTTVFDERLRTPPERPEQPRDRNATMTLKYGDPHFDESLALGRKDVLEIKNVPANVKIAAWEDDKGLLFFFFLNGADKKAHHYIPDGMQAITVNQQRRDVDQMRAEVYLAKQVPEAKGVKFPPLNQNTDAKAYGTAMSMLSDDLLSRMETALAQGANKYPDNSFFRLHLAELLAADAVKPVQDLIRQGNRPDYIDLDNTISQVRINQANQQLVLAQQAAQRTRNPFAIDQVRRSQELLAALPAALRALGPLELP